MSTGDPLVFPHQAGAIPNRPPPSSVTYRLEEAIERLTQSIRQKEDEETRVRIEKALDEALYRSGLRGGPLGNETDMVYALARDVREMVLKSLRKEGFPV